MKGNTKNNAELRSLAKQYPKLTAAQLVRITGFSYAFCYGWLADEASGNFRVMPDAALRLLKFELGIARAAFLGVKK